MAQAEIRAEMAAELASERQRVFCDAEDCRARLKADAAMRIEQELKTARAMLLEAAVADAVAAAEALVVARISQRDSERMAMDYVKSLPTVFAEKDLAPRGDE